MTQTSDSEMRVCILTSQYFGWGKIGGFGSMSRTLAESLARREYETSVIVPRRDGQKPRERAGGVEILSFSPFDIKEASRLIRHSRATLFHSQDPTFLTFLAQMLRRDAVHVVTCRDPRDTKDWLVEFRDATWGRRAKIPLNWFLEAGPLVVRAVRRAHGVYTPAHYLHDKVRRMFKPNAGVGLLPNLIDVPAQDPVKPEAPVLTFVGRLDKRKRPELFLDLAHRFPEYRFVVVGRAESEHRDKELQARYHEIANLEWIGYLDRFAEPERMRNILGETWVLVNTASREGLPLSFLEAAGHGCAIISAVNPDEFSTRFGVHVTDDDFAAAIDRFLKDFGAVRAAGEKARAYVQETYERERATDIHIEEYGKLINCFPSTVRN